MRVFITSTPDELELCQHAAIEITRELGHEPVLRNPAARRGLDPVSACGHQVAFAEAVLAIVGWRRGPVPSVALGGDGLRPWSYWEVESAFENGVPVVALLASEEFAPELREEVPEARAVVADFRGELARLAAVFEDETAFRRLARVKLGEAERASRATLGSAPSGLELRRYPPPELPAQPYPLLLPYTHPDLMAGRDEDLASLCRILERPVPVVGLHAVSGTGKSSLLAGGLVPKLRAAGRPVAFERHPAEPGLMVRLLGDLVESEGAGPDAGAVDARSFVDRLMAARRLAGGSAPVLVIDQFEDLLQASAEAARAALGPLLAASAQRLPGQKDPPCRWLLAYRREYHGRLVEWLEDVLRDARNLAAEGIDMLPHDLAGSTRFVDWSLAPLGTMPAGSGDAVGAATQVFLDAIEKPLEHEVFPWTFAPGHAERLARAFAEARVRRAEAPLVPELQVVLAHLLEQAGESVDGEAVTVRVPEAPGEMIDRALEEHLGRALDFAFPHGLDKAARIARTRALLVLRELAGAHGRREEGRAGDVLAAALGEEGREILEKFATPQTRIVIREWHDDQWTYVLAHDQLAEVLVRVVDEGRWAGLGIDSELLGLRRFVVLQSQLYASGDVEQATALPVGHFRKIVSNQTVVFWKNQHRAWWEACRARRTRERWHIVARWTSVAVVLVLVMVAVRLTFREYSLGMIVVGSPERAFTAIWGFSPDEMDLGKPEEALDWLRERERPFDIFERGLGGALLESRAEALVEVAEFTMPILEESQKDPALIASLVWALDFFAIRDPIVGERARTLRQKVLELLRRGRPPPIPSEDDPDWVDIPAGTVWLGADSKQPYDHKYQVAISAFRMMSHEVTNAEYRRLFPDHEGVDTLPAITNWYEAYTYAAWLGGRLPTEEEWVYAARAGCNYKFCKRDGSPAKLDDVAWWQGNSVDPRTGEYSLKPVMLLEPNPWGLWDVYGNASEWNANWHDGSRGNPRWIERDPSGPVNSFTNLRIRQRGGIEIPATAVASSHRRGSSPDLKGMNFGFRVLIMK